MMQRWNNVIVSQICQNTFLYISLYRWFKQYHAHLRKIIAQYDSPYIYRCFPKTMVPPKSSTFNRVFHDFQTINFGGFTPIFGSTPIYYPYNDLPLSTRIFSVTSPVNLPGLNSSGAEWKSGTSAGWWVWLRCMTPTFSKQLFFVFFWGGGRYIIASKW